MTSADTTTASAAADKALRVLPAPPKMGPLYFRAAIGARGPHGKSVPNEVYELKSRAIDATHLAAYQRVCGFGGRDILPVTYLHMLAFPLQMQLMVQPAFPFPLLGAVHVNNTITQLRPVTLREKVDVRVHAENLRPHAVGRQIDLVSEAFVDGTLVWRDVSTYLNRTKSSGSSGGSGAKEKPHVVADLPGGIASIVRVPADIGRRYAAVSGDVNPIHMSGLSAKAFGFKGAIAHGMWLKARTVATLEGRLPEAFTVDVAFKTPVFVPATIAVRSEHPTGQPAQNWTLDVRNARSGKPHLAGTVIEL